MKEKWIILNKKGDYQEMAQALSLDPLTARILANRDVKDAASAAFYLQGTLEDLRDPALLKDGQKAVEMLAAAVEKEEKIAVASDYDADGIFAGQILKESLENLGCQVLVLAPHRVDEGYGLNERIVDEAQAYGASLLLTCDNGIAAAEPIRYALAKNLQVIVTDHHEVPVENDQYILPPAHAVVNPKQPDCPYPFKGICGAVVALKLMQLLYRHLGQDERALLQNMAAYAAMATVADMMELRDENRILVREGLVRLRESGNMGLTTLLAHLDLKDKNITPYHIGFVIGPCINAAGRLESARLCQTLLGTRDAAEATSISARLVELNKQRQTMTEEGAKEAEELAEKQKDDRVLVLHLPDLHESIAGIVASRIKEKHYKPVLMITGSGAHCKGSARSVEAYPLFDKLRECAALFTRLGGHALAAGFSLQEENIALLRKSLNENSGLTDEDLCPIIKLDAVMPPAYATADRIRQWESLAPFGNGFERPLFGRNDLTVNRITVLGVKRNALRLRFSGEEGGSFEGIWFGDTAIWEAFIRDHYGEKTFTMLERGQTKIRMALAYQPMLHEYNGFQSIQFQIRHFQAVT